MDSKQAIEFLVSRAYNSPIPKGFDGIDASKYLNNIEEAKNILLSLIEPPKEVKKK